jgi:hypothetical protein
MASRCNVAKRVNQDNDDAMIHDMLNVILGGEVDFDLVGQGEPPLEKCRNSITFSMPWMRNCMSILI